MIAHFAHIIDSISSKRTLDCCVSNKDVIIPKNQQDRNCVPLFLVKVRIAGIWEWGMLLTADDALDCALILSLHLTFAPTNRSTKMIGQW